MQPNCGGNFQPFEQKTVRGTIRFSTQEGELFVRDQATVAETKNLIHYEKYSLI